MNLRLGVLAVGYGALLVYASLYPFTGWQAAGVDKFAFLTGGWPTVAPTIDNYVNVLAYLPLGLLLALSLRSDGSFALRVIAATLAAFALSLSMEFAQQYLPGRFASQADLATNSCGALIGALVSGLFDAERLPGQLLRQWRVQWVKPGAHFSLALAAPAAWALSQWLPGLPSFTLQKLREAIVPAWNTAQDLSRFDLLHCGRYALYVSGLALLVKTLAKPGRPAISVFFCFVALVFACKAAVIGRELSLEAISGAFTAVLLAGAWLALRAKTIAKVGAFFILGGLFCAHLLPPAESVHHLSNWTPLRGPIDHPTLGLGSVLEIAWPAAALGFLGRMAAAPEYQRAVAWGGGVALAVTLMAVGMFNTTGHAVPLITVVLMAGTYTLFGLLFLGQTTARALSSRTTMRAPSQAGYAVPITAGVATLIALTLNTAQASSQHEFDELARAPNVVRALRGDEPGFVRNDPKKYWLAEGYLPGSKTKPVFDRDVGGLRFDIVPTPAGADASDIAGAIYFNFGRHFGANERFRVRWQQMFNEAMLTVDFRNTAIKQAIVGSGDGPGLRHQASCTAPEIVVTSYYMFRFSQLYHSCGRYWPLYGTPRFNFQNMQAPTKGQYCNYDATENLAKEGKLVRPPAACAGWGPAMVWQDYALEVENGPFDKSGSRYTFSVVRLYVGKNPDGTLHLAHEWDSRDSTKIASADTWGGHGLFVGSAARDERFYGKFWATPYMTGYKGGHTKVMQTWYRHFIVTDETNAGTARRR